LNTKNVDLLLIQGFYYLKIAVYKAFRRINSNFHILRYDFSN